MLERLNKKDYFDLLNQLGDGVYILDPQRIIRFWNKSAEMITGYKKRDVLGSSCRDNLLIHVDEAGRNLCLGKCPVRATFRDGKRRLKQAFLHHRDGQRIPVLMKTIPLRDGQGSIYGVAEIFHNITPEFQLQKELQALKKASLIDPLTQIGNRAFLEKTLRAKLNELRRFGWQFGVLLLDIDLLKEINDTYGHDLGDQTLCMVAKTLRNSIRSMDFAGRFGGDEFVAILSLVNEKEIRLVGEKIRSLIEQSVFFVDNEDIRVTVSVGGAIAGKGESGRDLLKRADAALYRCKRKGRNCVYINALA